MEILNKQYSYTDINSFITSLTKKNGWLMIKQGLTLKQEIEERAEKQQDNASSTADIIVFSTLVIENNNDPKLDDKIRDELHKTDEFMRYTRFDNIKKKHEWSWVKIDDLIPNFAELRNEFQKLQNNKNIFTDEFAIDKFVAKNFLYNPEFMDALDKRVFDAKRKAVKKLIHKNGYKDITLRPWQKETVDEMVNANKFYNLLSLAPRFGKTITILEYALTIARELKNKKIVLLPASKNLASNYSFEDDYSAAGFAEKNEFGLCNEGSLFVASSDKKLELSDLIAKRIEVLKDHIDQDALVILVTDEADIASHTDDSIQFLEAIKHNFNVIKHVAMSGTGIFKAAKIFRGIPESDIFFKAINYTELAEYGVNDLVKRNFYNIKYKMEDLVEFNKKILIANGEDLDNLSNKNKRSLEVFNINESFEQKSAWDSLSAYIKFFVNGKAELLLGLQKSDVVMLFTPSKTVKTLESFDSHFRSLYNDIETIVLTGNTTTNREAQDLIKDKIRTMKKTGDKRKLLIFSMAMGSRSFSVSEIRRVIIMGDGDINAAWYQKSSRCLTYDYSKLYTQPQQEGDIIRISFGGTDLFSEIFLIENENIVNDNDTNTRTYKQLTRNSFIDVTIEDMEDLEELCFDNIAEFGNSDNDVIERIDTMLKYTDTTNFIVGQLFSEDLEIDEKLANKEKKGKVQKSSVDLSVPNVDKHGKILDKNIDVDPNKMTAQKEKALKVYVEILRTLPYVASELLDSKNLNELLKADWEGTIIIDKDQFKENLKNKQFEGVVDMIFRNVRNTDEVMIEKLEDYAALK